MKVSIYLFWLPVIVIQSKLLLPSSVLMKNTRKKSGLNMYQ